MDGNRMTMCKPDGNTNINMKIWHMSNKARNSLIKQMNGNRKNSIKVQHWNLGSRHWQKKIEDIQLLVDKHKPQVLFISEANLYSTVPEYKTVIECYDLYKTKSFESMGCSRLVMLVENFFEFKMLENHMEDSVASLWIEIKTKGRKKSKLAGYIDNIK